MALLNCDECGKEISSKAKSCPYCGARRKKIGCLEIIGIVVAVLIIAFIFGDHVSEKESALNACVEAQFFVKDKLRAPSTADFSDCSDSRAKKGTDGVWSVGGYVDSQNGFGAKIRSIYLVQMTYDAHADPKWTVKSIEVEPK